MSPNGPAIVFGGSDDDDSNSDVKIQITPSEDELSSGFLGINFDAKRKASIASNASSTEAPKKEMLQNLFKTGLPKSPSSDSNSFETDSNSGPSSVTSSRPEMNSSSSNIGTGQAKLPKQPSSLFGKIASAFQKKKVDEGGVSYDLDDMIKRLIECADVYSESCVITPEEIFWICKECTALTMAQPVLIEVGGPIFICGDIHGQYSDLLRVFKECGGSSLCFPEMLTLLDPSTSNYLFLGDYVDRGKQSMETILLQMCYKLKYPDTFFLLRGNHECASVNRVYGFYDECKRKSNMKVWKSFTDYFNVLPLAAVISEKVLVHFYTGTSAL